MFDKSKQLTITLDPFTYFTLDHLAKIKGKTIDAYATDLITDDPNIWPIAEKYFALWMKEKKD